MKDHIKLICVLVLFSFLLTSCVSVKSHSKKWSEYFSKENINGTFVLLDVNTDNYKYYNEDRADSSFIPASTYKILNSLIALETNAISNEDEIIKWDGIDKGWSAWNKDQNMKSAISISCIWFYQELARRIGKKKMQFWIDSVGYGNQQMGGNIDDFWLEGDIKISAREQVLFIKKLIENKLPFSIKNQEKVKQIMITDSTDTYIIHSKTGWGVHKSPQIGWLVGYVKNIVGEWIFALNIDIRNRSDLKYRKQIVYNILRKEGIIPKE